MSIVMLMWKDRMFSRLISCVGCVSSISGNVICRMIDF